MLQVAAQHAERIPVQEMVHKSRSVQTVKIGNKRLP